MALKNFIKENFVLLMGLTLPVLLIVMFFVAVVLPKSMAVPPQYEMLFSTTRFDYQNPPPYNIDFLVRDGMLKVRAVRNKLPNDPARAYLWKNLMAYDGKRQSVHEVPYDLSKLSDIADGSEVVLDEFKKMKVDSSSKAPDGYEFNNGGYHSGGAPMGIFWGGGYRNSSRVTKGAVSFKIPETAHNDYSYNIQFVGWVLKKE